MFLSQNDKILLVLTSMQAFLPLIVVLRIGFLRLQSLKKGIMPLSFYKLFRAKPGENIREPEIIEQTSRNFTNLSEAPILFFALVPLLFYTQKINGAYIFLSALFVFSRYLHSGIQLTSNKVKYRFPIYTVGVLTLIALWVKFLFDVLGS